MHARARHAYSQNNEKRGFTLLEILIVVAIFAGLLAISAVPLMSFYRKVIFQGAVENVLTMLDEARKSTLSSFHSSQYGVHFSTSTATLFKGDTYVFGAPDNDVYTFPGTVEISTTTLNGGVSDIVFERITGETSGYGTIVMNLLVGSTSPSVISIHPSGLVELND